MGQGLPLVLPGARGQEAWDILGGCCGPGLQPTGQGQEPGRWHGNWESQAWVSVLALPRIGSGTQEQSVNGEERAWVTVKGCAKVKDK